MQIRPGKGQPGGWLTRQWKTRGVMIIVGHRGARDEAPENTLPGFRYAMELGLESIEFDVRMTVDEHLVVIHDDSVDRTTNGTGKVAEMTLADIQALDARSGFAEWNEPCHVPTLAEALETLRTVPHLICEIKSDTDERLERIVPMVLAQIEAAGIREQVTVTSFNPHAVLLVQKHASDMKRGYIGDWNAPFFLEKSIEMGCTQADVHHPTADPELVRRAKEHGMRVICWPTNSQDELDHALSFEPDLFCTDKPSRLRPIYEERSARHA